MGDELFFEKLNREVESPDPLVRHVLNVLGNKISETDVFALVNTLSQAGHLTIDDKGKVLYHF
jgi:hypothetical protein